jgi:hypothetical protein
VVVEGVAPATSAVKRRVVVRCKKWRGMAGFRTWLVVEGLEIAVV